MGPGRPKFGPGGSRDLQIWLLDGLEGGLEGSGFVWMAILEVQRPVWTPSWGHLGAPGGVSEAILEDLGDPKRVQKGDFWDPEWKSAKWQNPVFSYRFLMIFGVWRLWKSIRMGSGGYQNRCGMGRGPKTWILEDWRFAGMGDWDKGKFGVENGCFGGGKLVSGRPK